MKNIIIVDVDSTRSRQIILGKPNDFIQPSTNEEIKQLAIDDIRCLTEALNYLIKITNNEHLKDECIKIIMNE